MPDSAVLDNPLESRFTIETTGGTAELVYRLKGNRLVLVHTGVPAGARERGTGGRLVAAAIDRAAVEGLTVVPVCPFVRNWLDDHPEEAKRVEVSD